MKMLVLAVGALLATIGLTAAVVADDLPKP